MSFFSEMNIPNRLTVIRVLMVPVFVLFMCLSVEGGDIDSLRENGNRGFVLLRWLSLIVFCAASLTDLLDGLIARKKNLITDFGKFMDPIADKLLVCSALILFAAEGSLPAWVTVLIISRELLISGIRLLAIESGVVIAASKWGKLKTDIQIAMSIWFLLPVLPAWLLPFQNLLSVLLIGGAAVLTVISLFDYIVKNRKIFLKCTR